MNDLTVANDPEYRRSLQDWNSYVESLTQRIIAVDPTIPELPLKDVVFRIYRDIRFSNDPTPYKPHFSVAFSRTGRKGPYACYYVHCEPGSCFIGGGLWHPDAGHLAKLRASIDERPRRWRRALLEDEFRKEFLPGAKRGDEKSCLKAFCKANVENALKTKPKVGNYSSLPSPYASGSIHLMPRSNLLLTRCSETCWVLLAVRSGLDLDEVEALISGSAGTRKTSSQKGI